MYTPDPAVGCHGGLLGPFEAHAMSVQERDVQSTNPSGGVHGH